MSDVNRSPVSVRLKDVRGKFIRDKVEIKLYNQRAQSLNQRFSFDYKGAPMNLKDVPAFPTGLAEAFINPTKFRYKSIFVSVPAGKAGLIEETFFVEPEEVEPVFPDFSSLKTAAEWKDLWRILNGSGITSASAWNKLSDLQKAGLFNLQAKTRDQEATAGLPVVTFIQSIKEFRPERIFAIVQSTLLNLVRNAPKFHSVSGALHKFPVGWTAVDPEGSFKTPDKAGNLQLTFAQNAAGEFMADIDLDDHQGLEHVGDVLKHKITGKETHPYDIHEILIYFQNLDPGYELE